ncbi:MAG: TIGR03663 family protein [Caldilineaceae bacterium]|nr:TIGR03663 family protein [Caldilineaceae bacterium]
MGEARSEKEEEAKNEVSENDGHEASTDILLAEEQEEGWSEAPDSQESADSIQTETVGLPEGFLDSNLLSLLRASWESVAWAVILIVAIVSRFYALGDRGMSHDESLHAVYSLDLYRSGSYQHNPMMHGPFLFHANAFIYFLFGVSDATARVMPALAGIGTIVVSWFFRRWIGRTGALLTALLFLFSPSILFHSRYIRNDIYIVFFSMLWVYFMFRYVEERKLKWLYYTVTVMALGFAAKENQFMSGTIFGLFMVGAAAWRWWTGQEELRGGAFGDIAVLLLTLVLPFAAPIGHLALGWDALAYRTTLDLTRSALLVVLMTGLSAAIAYWWFGPVGEDEDGGSSLAGNGPEGRVTFSNWGALMALFWAIEILLFTTFFTNPVDGLATGVVGSLGYWLAQQAVQRGSQPWFYYILQSLLYEFVLLYLSLGGLTLVAHNLLRGRWWGAAAKEKGGKGSEGKKGKGGGRHAAEGGAGVTLVRPYLVLFLAWWGLGAWLSYTYAGEKMPWLTTHMAQPMALFGGWWGAEILRKIDWKRVRETQGWWLLGLLPALIFVVATLASSIPGAGRDVDTLSRSVRFILALGLLGALLYLIYFAFLRSGWRLTLRLTAVTAFTVLFLLTIRFSYLLTYVNYDMATEYLVYAHASPDVKRALQEIDTISERTVGEREIQVSYDDDVAWPMTWYMRFYPNHIFYGANPTVDAMSAPIILVGKKNYEAVAPYVVRDYVHRNYRLVWWPEESYKSKFDEEGVEIPISDRIWDTLTDPERRSGLWQIFFFRNHLDRTLTEWPNRHDFRMYVRRDIAEIVWDLNVVPTAGGGSSQSPSFSYDEVERTARAAYSGLYDAVLLANPRAIAIGADGRRYILDTGNNRVVVLNSDGTFLMAFGSTCFLVEGASGGCTDADGEGPRELGDGQFREPWGIAVGAEGTVFVADTWNGRIQVFDRQGNFLRKWGSFSVITENNRDPFALFGPRGLAVTPAGNLLVADTGNKRIIEFSPLGEFVRQVGGGGIILGHFEEPVDVTIHPPSGNVLVTDAWNRRIQVLSSELVPLFEWLIPTWESQEIWDKPFLAAASDGTVYASDPQFAQIYAISSAGQIQYSFGRYGGELNRFAKPTGIAIDPLTGEILVADADNHRILVFSGN